MAIREEDVFAALRVGLGFGAELLPAPWGTAVGIAAELLEPIKGAVDSGGTKASIVAAVNAALVAASDADMKTELGPRT